MNRPYISLMNKNIDWLARINILNFIVYLIIFFIITFGFSLNGVGTLLVLLFSLLLIILTFKGFKKLRKYTREKFYYRWLLHDFILNNNLFSEGVEQWEEHSNGSTKIRSRKIIQSSAVFSYEDTPDEFVVLAYKMGNIYDKRMETLDTELQGLLALPIENKQVLPDVVRYIFLKNKKEIEQYVFSNTLTREFFEDTPLDIIRLSNTQQFSLKRNTNIGLYGRTGSGKTVTLQWLLYNAISKGCGCSLYPNTYLSVVDGKGADLYSLGEILQETLGEQINIGQTPHSLAKLSREFCQIMNERFELIKNSETLNADAYDLKMIPNFLFVDELASIRDSCGSSKEGKALWNEILQNLGLIARKGRQAGCHLCISTQDPNAENIPVELRNQISAVLYMGSPSADRIRMAFAMCELENVPTVTGRKGEALFYADSENMVEPEITVAPFVDLKTKQEFKQVVLNIVPKPQ